MPVGLNMKGPARYNKFYKYSCVTVSAIIITEIYCLVHDYTSVCTYMYINKFHNCNCVTVSAVTIVNKLKVIAYNLIISIKLYFCAYLQVQPHVHNIIYLLMIWRCHSNVIRIALAITQ